TEMATFFPQTLPQMEMISGVGDAKLKKYCPAFVRAISEYCAERGIESRVEERRAPRRSVARKLSSSGSDTYSTTLHMFRDGDSPEVIARKRGLALSTIQGQLTRFIPTGEVALDELVPPGKITVIKKALID